MIKTAYLRVYMPEELAGRWPPHADGVGRNVVRASDHFVWDEPLNEDAFELVRDGRRYLCPRLPRLRMLEGLVAFARSYPTLPLIPPGHLDEYTEELSRLRSAAAAGSHILSSPWHVPLRWFAAFMPADRELYDAPDGPAIRYRGNLAAAVDRIAWASRVLDDAGFSDQVVDQVRGLEHWLSEFRPDAVVELDYGDVAALFTAADLALDESCAEVRDSLEALERGDYDEAGEHYMAVAARWAPFQALTYSN